MTRLRERCTLAALVAAEAGAVVLLHRLADAPGLGAGGLGQPGSVAAADAVMASARLVALAAAWWLLATTVASATCAAARMLRVLPRAVRLVEGATPAPIRALAQRAVAATLSVSVAAAGAAVPAAAHDRPAAGSAVAAKEHLGAAPSGPGDDGVPVVQAAVVVPPALLPPAALPDAPVEGDEERVDVHVGRPADADPGGAAPDVHVVQPGEHLWRVAAARVAAATARQPADVGTAEVAAYWRRLVAANRSALGSGDPDLVYPGERLVLPPVARLTTPECGPPASH